MPRGAMLITAMATALVVALPPVTAQSAAVGPSEPTAEQIERARTLDENARQLYDEGSYEGAILAWEKAYELTGYNNLLYNISMAHDRAGDFDKALAVLDRYRALATPAERAQLERRKKSLLARLAKQKEAEAAAADGATDLPPEPEPDTDEPPPPPPAPAATQAPPALFTPTAWALTATAAAGFGLGIGFGAASLSATRRAEDGCSGSGGATFCSTQVERDVTRARTFAIVTDVSLAVGAVATVALVAVLAVRAKRRNAARGTALAPTLLPGGAGLGVATRF